jgi:hypothetical protein
MLIHTIGARGRFDQVTYKHQGLGPWHALDAPDVRGKKKAYPTSGLMSAYKALTNWCKTQLLFLGKTTKAELGSTEKQGVLAYEWHQCIAFFGTKRLIGESRITKFGLATLTWNLSSMQERVLGRLDFEAAIAMPESITEIKHATAIVDRENRPSLIEVRNIIKLRVSQAMLFNRHRCTTRFHLTEIARKSNLGSVVEHLLCENQNSKMIYRLLNACNHLGTQGLA